MNPIKFRVFAHTMPVKVKGKKQFRVVVSFYIDREHYYHIPDSPVFPNRIKGDAWVKEYFDTAEQLEAWANGFFLSKPKAVKVDSKALKGIWVPKSRQKAIQNFVAKAKHHMEELEHEAKDGSFPDEIDNCIWNLKDFGIVATVKKKEVSYSFDPKAVII